MPDDTTASDETRGARPKREARISTPVVLALSSAMLAVAIVVVASLDDDGSGEVTEAPPHDPQALRVDDSTAERVAESFYDAWRRRQWQAALTISVGEARHAVLEKRARDEAMEHDERIVAERTWDALAHAPLTLALDEAEMLEGDRVRLRGTAEYTFVGHPYRRRVEFLVVPGGEGRHRVAEMVLGEVLTELPALFRGTPMEAP